MFSTSNLIDLSDTWFSEPPLTLKGSPSAPKNTGITPDSHIISVSLPSLSHDTI